jgi:hypothetical protein
VPYFLWDVKRTSFASQFRIPSDRQGSVIRTISGNTRVIGPEEICSHIVTFALSVIVGPNLKFDGSPGQSRALAFALDGCPVNDKD